MHHLIQTLSLLLCCVASSWSQYYLSGYGADPQIYGSQNYDPYSNAMGYGYAYGTGYFGGPGYSYPAQTRSVDDLATDATFKNAMAPLNNIVSSGASLPLPASPIEALLEPQLRSAEGAGNEQQKKSNCTTGCSTGKNAVPESKQAQLNQQTVSQSSQQMMQQSSAQGAIQGTQMCQCPCTQGYMSSYSSYPYYMPQSYAPPQYPKSGTPYYTVAHRTRQPYRSQYRPYSYIRPYYYDPNYQRGYYASIRK
ncbi:uncharacterized protein [Halyomorpha halys]|uniref:uncharacterized protein n=1 Tax=Halyomorpha halys TaxID=286706 RepID=UPI0006D50A45|nr:uncharacterized protein LOC106690844 [Halyomorpha halys]